MVVNTETYQVTWEKLPDDFVLPDDPVDNIIQPILAAALKESLELAGILPDNSITTTNYGICATVNGKMVVKAPDWAYVRAIHVPKEEVNRSYTPKLQGEIPVIVMEFLSDTEGGEYSSKPTYPPGKWFFYEQILQVPNYIIFEPREGRLEVYSLDDSKQYKLQPPDSNGRYLIAQMNLFLGVWEGIRDNKTGFWLRWWNDQGTMLLWGTESVESERQRADTEKQRADTEKQRADTEKQRADRLADQLRAAGIDPNE
ncbi:MAG: Uma2 family endonuclease [Gomphosphaeria aponina SAG 52.96 = DSM 107014]|uniref:Uma2 family endonuclease n=1 Tax=Gomphosphaeria aponina SAG 52.96 = DSM 107014 TaxID=1521640 RepID=A0A941GP28_9CHRO|nr:Uma2 family endonuclease [Gomphosphaeria aponina SAG 52.96 = DSM 107014]